ncbi:MAG: SpoIIE family protein phosphatase [Bacteroidetes bacterium]|nr:SpoIIE family protein phosphatase [Bacteroidota bacterium]
MFSHKNIITLSLAFGIISWVLLLVFDILILFSTINKVDSGISPLIPHLIFDVFVVSLFLYYRYGTEKAESINFLDLLWRVFVTGLIATVVSLLIKLLLMMLSGNKLAENVFLINIFYHINLGLIVAFLISTFVVWKRMILYQKTKILIKTWNFFQTLLFVGLISNFFDLPVYGTAFNTLFVSIVVLGLVLSINLKWVAYLNFKQKWKSILFIVLVLIYLGYFFLNLSRFSNSYILSFDLLSQVFILSLVAFIFIYSLFSVLVILFNLPTSSVFEQKLKEALNFQRLSQSIPKGENEEQVYNVLLDSSVSTLLADAAWLEINENHGGDPLLITRGVTDLEVDNLKDSISQGKVKYLLDPGMEPNKGPKKLLANLKGSYYKSAILLPISVQDQTIGSLTLLKTVRDGFNREMVDIVNTFLNQASISIENFRLLSEALENERYKEELKIARRVQRSLLPHKLEINQDFEIVAFSRSADEIGGDYYDNYKINENKFALIIGDVSGKGTSAAFNMSQMKGVFHSLAQLDLTAKQFLVKANNALGLCLEKTSFITASFFIIDTTIKEIEFARAGHCPTLYYSSKKNETFYFKNKGLGLGIIRNSDFKNYIQTTKFEYKKDDIMMLYTDGVTEARNQAREEYGYDRLQQFLNNNTHESPERLKKLLIEDLHQFCGFEVLEDDYTAMILKFK